MLIKSVEFQDFYGQERRKQLLIVGVIVRKQWRTTRPVNVYDVTLFSSKLLVA